MAIVLVSDPIADKGIELLEEAGFDIVYNPNPSDDELQAHASDAHAWVVRSGTKITPELLKDASNLQVIGVTNCNSSLFVFVILFENPFLF